MARIAGVDLPRGKRIEVALTYIYGIGDARAKEIIEAWLGWIWELAADLDVAQAAGDDPKKQSKTVPKKRSRKPAA